MSKKQIIGGTVMVLVGIYPGLFLAYNIHSFLSGGNEVETSLGKLVVVFMEVHNIRLFFGIFQLLLITFIGWA